MNFLQIFQRAVKECRIPGTTPTTAIGQTGLLDEMVNWTADAYREIQNKREDWRWLRSTFTVPTVASTDAYAYGSCTDGLTATAITRFAHWLPFDESGRTNTKIYLTSTGVSGERWLPFMAWGRFGALYKFGAQNDAPPAYCTINPQNKLILGPKPDAVYTVSGEYQMSAQELAADADTPEMPTRFHMLVVYEVMQKYGLYKVAQETLIRGQAEANKMWSDLMLDQLPKITFGGPLA